MRYVHCLVILFMASIVLLDRISFLYGITDVIDCKLRRHYNPAESADCAPNNAGRNKDLPVILIKLRNKNKSGFIISYEIIVLLLEKIPSLCSFSLLCNFNDARELF